MEVSKVQFHQNNQFYTPAFSGSSRRCGVKVSLNGQDILRNNFTRIGRDSEWLNRKELVNHLLKLTEKKDAPVELLFCGCSDGSEPIDIMMALVKALKDQNRKFPDNLKITAFDRDEVMVNAAAQGRLNLTKEEIGYINQFYPNDYYHFVQSKPLPVLKLEGDENLSEYINSYQFHPALMSKINFRQGELIKELESLDPNTHKIIFCRNVAIYLPYEEQRRAAELINQKLRPESLLVCGYRDTDLCTPEDAPKIYKELKYEGRDYTVRKGIYSNGYMYYWSVPNPFIERLEQFQFKNNKTIGCAYQKQQLPNPCKYEYVVFPYR